MTAAAPAPERLVDHFESGLDAPICLTWELTYACNLACVHCLSSSGRRDPRELTTSECRALIDELQRLQVFYVNIGGGEPTVRERFLGARRLRHGSPGRRQVLDERQPNHIRCGRATGRQRLRRCAGVDRRRDRAGQRCGPRRGLVRDRAPGDGATRRGRLSRLQAVGGGHTPQRRASWTSSRLLADRYEAQLRLTRLRPSGRGADVWDALHPTAAQQREVYDWLVTARRERADG